MRRFPADGQRAVFQVRQLKNRLRRLEGAMHLALAQADHAAGCPERKPDGEGVRGCQCWRRWAQEAVGAGGTEAKAA